MNKLKTTLFDLSNPSDAVKRENFKRTVYDKLIKKLMLLRLIILVT